MVISSIVTYKDDREYITREQPIEAHSGSKNLRSKIHNTLISGIQILAEILV